MMTCIRVGPDVLIDEIHYELYVKEFGWQMKWQAALLRRLFSSLMKKKLSNFLKEY